ncbi:MAG: hypothetical protein WC314_12920 [Vulcanimicrobiota bacterium]
MIAIDLCKGLLSPFGTWKPKTPIRWLCLKSFSYLAHAQNNPIEKGRFDVLNQALELGIYLNRCFDGKCRFQSWEYRKLRRDLPGAATTIYLRDLRNLEQNRPDRHDWQAIFHYRRGVLAVSLDYLFELSKVPRRGVLLPLVSLVQLIDDILDKQIDDRLGLPTFLCSEGPHPAEIAHLFWQEIKVHEAPLDRPFVFTGWLVFVLSRAVSACLWK